MKTIKIRHRERNIVLRRVTSEDEVGERNCDVDSEGGDLRNAELRWTDLSGADLRGFNLSGADLRGSNLQGAYLQGANLSGADLRRANLQGANLSGADLRGADLSKADLDNADLTDTELSGAILNWESRSLIAAILAKEAGKDPDRRALAEKILARRDHFWEDNLATGEPFAGWAIATLITYVREDDEAPDLLTAAPVLAIYPRP